jgi:hypothetical protein
LYGPTVKPPTPAVGVGGAEQAVIQKQVELFITMMEETPTSLLLQNLLYVIPHLPSSRPNLVDDPA